MRDDEIRAKSPNLTNDGAMKIFARGGRQSTIRETKKHHLLHTEYRRGGALLGVAKLREDGARDSGIVAAERTVAADDVSQLGALAGEASHRCAE